jgi:dihydropteroate synthase
MEGERPREPLYRQRLNGGSRGRSPSIAALPAPPLTELHRHRQFLRSTQIRLLSAIIAGMSALFWQCGDRRLPLTRPLVMGILNVTPDSFSDGGRHDSVEAAVAYGLQMIEEGADIIDVGGESTRPGARPVPAAEECARVVPVIRALADATDRVISVDTRKAAVARRALAAGARIVNDITALTGDRDMLEVVRESGAGAVLMHMQGTPETMQEAPHYGDVVAEVHDWLARRVAEVMAAGMSEERLAIDPGIGFGKTLEHNLALLGALERFGEIGPPLLVGLSRKGFIGKITGAPLESRLAGSLTALVWCIWRGAAILRVHDVRASCEALRMATALCAGNAKPEA